MSSASIIKAVEKEGVVVRGSGELDLHVGKEFDNALADAVATGMPVTVDFLPALFIDSAILQSLARHASAVSRQGRQMTVLVRSGSHPEYALRAVRFETFMNVSSVNIED